METQSVSARFKQAFRSHPAGVAVVACRTDDGPAGMTASSVASVSALPPLLSFSVSRTSRVGPSLVAASELSVNLLGAEHRTLARQFALHPTSGFELPGWSSAPDRPPVLQDAPAVLLVEPSRIVPAGDSWLVLAAVTDVLLGRPGEPLVYHDRRWTTPGAPLASSA